MSRFARITAHDAEGNVVGFAVIDLPDDHNGRPPWPGPMPSDSYFDTEEEAIEEIKQRANGKRQCECGCLRYPKGLGSPFLPGHDLKKAYQDQRKQQEPSLD